MHRWLWVAAGLAVVIAVVTAWQPWSDERGPSVLYTPPAPASDTPHRPSEGETPFATAVSSDGRHLVDQYGDPILLRGDSPWSLMTDLSESEVKTYFGDRDARGVNAVLVSLLGAEANGAPDDDGSTYDGIRPFIDDDVTQWNDLYWQRAREYVEVAADHGITVLLYPVDSWVLDSSLVPTDVDTCSEYGRMVAEHFADAPNIVWMAGGDYLPGGDRHEGTEVDHCVDAVLEGIRSTGDERLFSMQMGAGQPMTSTDDPYWRSRVDWNFVYTYSPTYRVVARAHRSQPPIPAIFGEGNYERENNQGNQPTTAETLRRQVAWALTSGAAGDFYGSDDWEFVDGWQGRLDAPGLADVGHVRDVFERLSWWELVPDDGDFLTGGRGEPITQDDRTTDVLDSDLATAAVAKDGSVAVVYVPTSRTITIDDSVLAPGVRASWVDPSTGQEISTPVGASYRTPGENADGDEDWLLVLSASGE